MFSNEIHNYENIANRNYIYEELVYSINAINKSRILAQKYSGLFNVDTLKDEMDYKKILVASRTIKASLFNNSVFALAPLYVTSICQEHCLYCNYRLENNDREIQRIRLSNEELLIEVEYLAKRGIRVIELVYATDPFIHIDNISEHIKITHDALAKYGGGMVGINSRPYMIEDYRKLKEAGLDFAVLWQETYDYTRYKQVHPGRTEKTNYYYRLDAPERMIVAGIENIGLGILSGLSDWRKDWQTLICHIQYLLQNYGNAINSIILGVPRLKSAEGAFLKSTPFVPNNSEYLLAISIFNLFLPSALPFINTRENWEICLEAAKSGGTLFTFDCKTIPGGYALGKQGYQFPTNNFSVEEYIHKMNGCGLRPIFDWSLKNINWKMHIMKESSNNETISLEYQRYL